MIKKSSQCPHCGFEYRLNVVINRSTKTKYLRTGCCDVALRPCPDPEKLLTSSSLDEQERDYLKRVGHLPWFDGQVAQVLLRLEAKIQVACNNPRFFAHKPEDKAE